MIELILAYWDLCWELWGSEVGWGVGGMLASIFSIVVLIMYALGDIEIPRCLRVNSLSKCGFGASIVLGTVVVSLLTSHAFLIIIGLAVPLGICLSIYCLGLLVKDKAPSFRWKRKEKVSQKDQVFDLLSQVKNLEHQLEKE